jgi:hypothetical protein
MSRWRTGATVAGLFAIGAIASGVSAYQGAQTAGPAADTTLVTNAPRGQWGYSAASTDQNSSPDQPIAFPHPQHVQKLGMNCAYCHFSANKSPDPGMPAVSTCMGCHTVIATAKPEIKKLTQYWTERKPIPWVRIHKVPDYVNFPHMRHVNAGVTCQSCHGQVQKMGKVFQYSSLNMGWCVNCHANGYDPTKADRESGFIRTANGFELVRGDAVSAAHAQLPDTGAAGGATAGQVKKARYDCAVCHY